MKIVLASGSPRRRELLGLFCEDFSVETCPVDETPPPGLSPEETVRFLARKKASALAGLHRKQGVCQPELIIGADTVVALDGRILGKPAGRQQAREMLLALSGRTHSVFTGVAMLCGSVREVFAQETQVEFYPLSQELIQWYLDSGEPFDKAGAYGIQGRGSLLVRQILGDYFNVVGLPVAKSARAMEKVLKQAENL